MFKMLSVFVFALIFSAISAQEVSCPDLLDSLLTCAGNESPTEEIVAIPVTCVEEAGATVEDLATCGLLDIPPSPETEVVEGEEEDTPEPVTLTIGEESSPDTVTLTILPEEPSAPEPVPFIIIFVPAAAAPAPVAPAPVTPTPTPTPTTPVPVPPVYAVAAAGASATVSGGAASADAAAVASIFS